MRFLLVLSCSFLHFCFITHSFSTESDHQIFSENDIDFSKEIKVYIVKDKSPDLVEYPNQLSTKKEVSLFLKNDTSGFEIILDRNGVHKRDTSISSLVSDKNKKLSLIFTSSPEFFNSKEIINWFIQQENIEKLQNHSSWEILQLWNLNNRLSINPFLLAPNLKYIIQTPNGTYMHEDSSRKGKLAAQIGQFGDIFTVIPGRNNKIRLMHEKSAKFLHIEEDLVSLKVDLTDSSLLEFEVVSDGRILIKKGSHLLFLTENNLINSSNDRNDQNKLSLIPANIVERSDDKIKEELSGKLNVELGAEQYVEKGMTENIFRIPYEDKTWYLKFGPNVQGHFGEYQLFKSVDDFYPSDKKVHVKYLPQYNAIMKEAVPESISLNKVFSDKGYYRNSDIFRKLGNLIVFLIDNGIELSDLHGENIVYSKRYQNWYIIDSCVFRRSLHKGYLAGVYFHFFGHTIKNKINTHVRKKGLSASRPMKRLLEESILSPISNWMKNNHQLFYQIFIEGHPFRVKYTDNDGNVHYWQNNNQRLELNNGKKESSLFYAAYVNDNCNLTFRLMNERGHLANKDVDRKDLDSGIVFDMHLDRMAVFSNFSLIETEEKKYIFVIKSFEQASPYLIEGNKLKFGFGLDLSIAPKFEIEPVTSPHEDHHNIEVSDMKISSSTPVRLYYKAICMIDNKYVFANGPQKKLHLIDTPDVTSGDFFYFRYDDFDNLESETSLVLEDEEGMQLSIDDTSNLSFKTNGTYLNLAEHPAEDDAFSLSCVHSGKTLAYNYDFLFNGECFVVENYSQCLYSITQSGLETNSALYIVPLDQTKFLGNNFYRMEK